MRDGQTVAALSSGLVPSGVAVIRVSGPAVRFALERIAGSLPKPRYATRATLRHPTNGVALDDALVLFFPGPNSFTGEDVAELHCHGGPAVVDAVLGTLYELDGIAPAEPGAFTRQAFLNGKMDLTQVEAVGDLIHATTDLQRQQAMDQLGGRARDRVLAWRDAITDMRALIEADLDFSDEDDVPGSVIDSLPERLRSLMDVLAEEIADHWAERLRDGFRVVLVGAPNSGKSTLLNRLIDREAALVSTEAGTTRDVIDVAIDMEGLPIVLSDTAGLRDASGSSSVVEVMGMERTRSVLDQADCVVWLLGGDDDDHDETGLVASATFDWIRVRSKSDLMEVPNLSEPSVLSVSGQTGAGVSDLRSAIVESIRTRYQSALIDAGRGVALDARRRQALSKCLESLQSCLSQMENGAPMLDVAAEHLRLASYHLGTITGQVDAEHVLDRLFSRFCIGK